MFLNLPLRLLTKVLGIRMIMKSIPFRMPLYDDAIKESVIPLSGMSTPQAKLKRALGNIRRKFLVKLTASFYRSLDAHVNYVEDGIRIFGSYGVDAEKVFIIYNSPDTDKLLEMRKQAEKEPLILSQNPTRIIHVGRLVEWKRVDLLIGVVANLKEKYPNIELLVIGYGPFEKEWKDLASRTGVSDRVQFLGGVYDPLLLAKYHVASSVYVLAGMGGLSINEAMCFGLPIICSVGDGTEKHLVTEDVNGKFFKEGDVLDLTNKIDGLFADSHRCKEMGKNSVHIIESKINIHLVVKGYQNAIEFVLGRKLSDV